MQVVLVFYPPGENRREYFLNFNLPAVPRVGDHISMSRPQSDAASRAGTCDFIVRPVLWEVDYTIAPLSNTENPTDEGKLEDILIEYEIARGPRSSEEHLNLCKRLEDRGLTIKNI